MGHELGGVGEKNPASSSVALGASPSKGLPCLMQKPHRDIHNSRRCTGCPEPGDRRACPGKECLFQPIVHNPSCQRERKSREGDSRRLTWESINNAYRLWQGCWWVKSHHLIWVLVLQLLDLEDVTASHVLFPSRVGLCELTTASHLHFDLEVGL